MQHIFIKIFIKYAANLYNMFTPTKNEVKEPISPCIETNVALKHFFQPKLKFENFTLWRKFTCDCALN